MQMLLKAVLAVLLFFISTAPSYGQEPPKPKEETRERYSVVALSEKIYLIGGLVTPPQKDPPKTKGKKPLSSPVPKATALINCYDIKTNKFVSLSSLPTALYDSASVTLNNRIYVMGGYSPKSTPTNLVYSFNPEDNKVTKLAPLPTSLAGSRAIAMDGKIYVFGGKSKLPSKETLVYNPETNKWKKLSFMSTPREQVALSIVDGKVFVAGGKGLKNLPLSTFEEYDPLTNTWKMLAPMSSPRVNATGIALNHKFYIVGGYKATGAKQEAITTIDSYDLLTKTWTTFPSLTVPQDLVGALIANKELNMFTSETRIFALKTSLLALEKENEGFSSTTSTPTAIVQSVVQPIPTDVIQPIVQSTPIETPTSIPPVKPSPAPSPTPKPSQPSQPQSSQSPSRANRAPVISPIDRLSARIGQEICFTPYFADPESDPVTLSCILPNNLRYRIQGNTIYIQAVSTYRGNATSYLVAKDSYGNQTKQAFYIELLGNRSPSFSYISELANTLLLYAGQKREIEIQAIDPDSASDPSRDGQIALSLINAPNFVELVDYGEGRGKLVFYPQVNTNWNSNNQITIEVRDFGYPPLRSQLNFYINVKQPNRAPIVPNIPDIIMRAGETLRIPVNIYDPDGDYFRVDFTVSDYNYRNILQYSTGQLTLIAPQNFEGRFRATLIAFDNVGSRHEESFYVIIVLNHAPMLEHIQNIEVEENTQKQIKVKASDLDFNRDGRGDGYITLRLSEGPNFVDFYDQGNGQATITIKPRTGDAGRETRKKYTISLEASDNGSPSLKTSSSFAVIVVAPNSPPTISGLPSQIVRVRGGEQYCVDFLVSDPDNDNLDIDVNSNYPQYVHSSNSRICVQPALNFDGKIRIDVIAKDSRGKVAQSGFTVESFINHKPYFERNIGQISIEEEKTLSLQIKALDEDIKRDPNQDGRVELTLGENTPKFIIFTYQSPDSGILAINPLASTVGTYMVELIATDNGTPRLSNTLRFQLTVTQPKVLDPPKISSVRFEAQKLIILGDNFIEDCVVEVNGQRLSAGYFKQREKRLVLAGKRKELNLAVGQNLIVVISGNRSSNAFSYVFEKPQGNKTEDD